MSSNIPAAREILELMACHDYDGDWKADAAEALLLMKRSYVVSPTRVKHKKVTPIMAEHIRQYSKAHPDLSQEEVGRVFDVNAGRVSECMAGKR